MFHLEAIHKSKVEYQIQQRYRTELQQLQALGFDELHFTREVIFPFSALVFCWLLPYLSYKNEIYRIEMPLRIVMFQPLLFNHNFASYANVYGLGVSFSTLFTDGTVLISSNFKLRELIKPENKIYLYATENELPIAAVWQLHIERLYDIERKGRETREDLTLENYERISHRSDTAQFFGH